MPTRFFRLPIRSVRSALLVGPLLGIAASAAHAQRLVFQTGNALYTASADGRDPRRLVAFTGPVTAWAISPDGRRLVYAQYAPQAATDGGLVARPLLLRLTDIVGRHVKPLARTDQLRDRAGKRITSVGIAPDDLPPLVGVDAFPDRTKLDSYRLRSLSFSADSRTLYLSCTYTPAPTGEVSTPPRLPITIALDAATGTPVVDGDGRLKSLAPLAPLEARGSLLAGVGVGVGPDAAPYYPPVVLNLSEGTRTPLYTQSANATTTPPAYANVSELALAPENRLLALTAGETGDGGLWRTDKFGKTYTRLLAGSVRRPRFTPDGKQIFLLLARPGAATAPAALDLYALPVSATPPTDAALAPVPVLIRQGVDNFDIVPE